MVRGPVHRIKHLTIAVALMALSFALATGLVAATADWDLNWHVVSGGGGGSPGGSYQADGTTGQTTAGIVSGGDYLLGSGFWGGGQVARAAGGIYLPIIVR